MVLGTQPAVSCAAAHEQSPPTLPPAPRHGRFGVGVGLTNARPLVALGAARPTPYASVGLGAGGWRWPGAVRRLQPRMTM